MNNYLHMHVWAHLILQAVDTSQEVFFSYHDFIHTHLQRWEKEEDKVENESKEKRRDEGRWEGKWGERTLDWENEQFVLGPHVFIFP